MSRRQELYDRRSVASLIHVVEQVPLRAAVRRPLEIQHSSVGLLLLWSILRRERTFLVCTLERMGIDLWALTCDVDETLKRCGKQARDADHDANSDNLDSLLDGWLDRAAAEARGLEHGFLSEEHLLLAMLADGDPGLAAIFQRRGLTHEALRQAVADAIRSAAQPVADTPGSVAETKTRARTGEPGWIAEIDRPAVGVPRRFGVFILMLMVTLYAVLFSLLRLLRVNDLVFTSLALLFTGVGIGQACFFGGRYPRAASIWTGAILVPFEACACAMWYKNIVLGPGSLASLKGVAVLLLIFLLSAPLGAILGYLAGTVTAGGFCLVDWYEKRHPPAKESPAD